MILTALNILARKGNLNEMDFNTCNVSVMHRLTLVLKKMLVERENMTVTISVRNISVFSKIVILTENDPVSYIDILHFTTKKLFTRNIITIINKIWYMTSGCSQLSMMGLFFFLHILE